MALIKKQKYLQVALNNNLYEAQSIIAQLPPSEKILIEAGTPLIKNYGSEAISSLKKWAIEKIIEPQNKLKETQGIDIISIIKFLAEQKQKNESKNMKPLLGQKGGNIKLPFEPYIVADLKCMDLGIMEVSSVASAGANAATCLGQAPIETINRFTKECKNYGLDSIIDMMNIENPFSILRKLEIIPNVVILHRGVDETKKNKEKQIPWYQIKQIKGNYNDILIAVAGGDKIREVESAIFNDADIVVLWEAFYRSGAKITELTQNFLKEIR